MTYEEIAKGIRSGTIAPVYCLMGDEPFYIDRPEAYITEKVMPPANRDFDMELLYGSEVDAIRVADTCRQFPMLGTYRLVVVREFQQMRTSPDALVAYCKNPSPSTVLVLCHKNGSLDKRKPLYKAIEKLGAVLESKRIYERSLRFLHTELSEGVEEGHRAQGSADAGRPCGHRPHAHVGRTGQAAGGHACGRE